MSDALPSRIQEIPEDQLSAEQAEVIEALVRGRGRLLTPYRVWIHSPELARAMEGLGTFLNKRSSLTEREVELGYVLAATHWHGDYVVAAHVKTCLQLGFPASVMDAIAHGQRPELPDARERSIYELAMLAQQPGAGDDATFDAAVASLGREGVAEALALFGYVSALSLAMKLHRVPIPAA